MKPQLFAVLFIVVFIPRFGICRDELGIKKLDKTLRKPAGTLAVGLRGKVCVLDFSDLSDTRFTSEFGQKIADLLANHLVNRKNREYRIMERRELIKIVQDAIVMVGDDAQVIENLQKNAGMDYLISGSYSVAGSEISINFKTIDARSGTLVSSAAGRMQKTEGLGKMISRRFLASEKPEAGSTVLAGGSGTLVAEPSLGSEDVLELEAGIFFEGGDGKLYPLRDGMVLNSKDNYALYLKPSESCHVYIYQVDSSRKVSRIFPNRDLSTGVNPLEASREYWIPNQREFLFLDESPGNEEIYIFATHEPSAGLENIKEADFPEIRQVIKTMGLAGKRRSEMLRKVSGVSGNALELLIRKLAARGDFYHKISFIHQ